MFRLIACDLDETLISDDRTISLENKKAIQLALEKGVKFVPCTGRGYKSLKPTLQELGLYDTIGQYCISYNGGVITENKDEKIMYFQGISFEEANALYKKGLSYGDVCMHVYTTDMVWVRNFFPGEEEYLSSRQACTEIFSDDIEFLRGKETVKFIYANLDHAYLESIAKDISLITKDMDISYSSNRYMELNHKGVSKGNGLVRLCESLGIDLKDTIAIGDNYNDLSMIQAAGLGVGVANTVEEMKAQCDEITENDCNHSAVAEVIEKYIL